MITLFENCIRIGSKNLQMGSSPTQRSLKLLRDQGWIAEVAERWIPAAKRRKDLFGIIDVIGIRGSETIGVQATSYSNVSHRVNKVANSEHINDIRDAGWRLEVHGWRKVKNRWTCRVVDVS